MPVEADLPPNGAGTTPRRRIGSGWLWTVLAGVVLALVLWPLLPVETLAFRNGAEGIRTMLERPSFGEVLRTTIYLGVGSVVVALLLGTTLALCVHGLPPRLRRFVVPAPLFGLIIPSTAHVIGFAFLLSPSNGYLNTLLRRTPFFDHLAVGPIDVYTTLWIVLYTGFALTAFVYLFVYTGLEDLGDDYRSAASTCGAGPIRTLFSVTLPLLRPNLVYAAALVLLLGMGQFTAPLFLGRRQGVSVLSTEIYYATSDYPVNWELGAAWGTPLLVLGALIVLLMWRSLRRQRDFRGTRGHSAPGYRTVTGVTVRLLTLLAFTAISAILPILALVYVAFSAFWSGDISFSHLTTAAFSSVLDNDTVTSGILTSVRVSALAVALALGVGLMASLALTNRESSRLARGTIDVASMLPLALPAALFGYGFLFAYSELGLYGSQLGLALAYVTVMIPFAIRYQLASIIAMGEEVVDAARVSGAGAVRACLEITIPLARRGMAAAAAVMFILLLPEFGVSVLLRAPGTSVMSTELYDFWNAGRYPEVAAMGLLMFAVIAIATAIVLSIGSAGAMRRSRRG